MSSISLVECLMGGQSNNNNNSTNIGYSKEHISTTQGTQGASG